MKSGPLGRLLRLTPGDPRIGAADARLRDVARALVANQSVPGWDPVTSSAQARVARGQVDGKTVFLKVFLPRSSRELLKSIGRGSRGVRAARRTAELRADGFDAPAVLAHGWAGNYEILLMEEVKGQSLLRLLSRRLGPPLADLTARRRLLRGVGREVARMHAAGWVHGDLRLGNVLLRDVAPDREPRFCFLDNESSRKSNRPGLRERNLVQFNMIASRYLSRTDRCRVLAAYASQMGMDRRARHSLGSHVWQRTVERWQARDARGGPKPRHRVEPGA